MTGRRRVEKQVVQYLPIFNDMNRIQQQARLTMINDWEGVLGLVH